MPAIDYSRFYRYDELMALLRGFAAEQMRAAGDVEHVLVTPLNRGAPGNMQNPVGVRPKEVAVWIYHLALKPETEFNTFIVDVLDDWSQPIWPRFFRNYPIT